MIDIVQNTHDATCRFILRPNRSMSWQGSLLFFLSLCLVSGTVAISMALLGYWLILPFAGLELMALGTALYIVALRCYQREVIWITNDIIQIEKGRNYPQQQWRLARVWVQVVLERCPQQWYPSRLLIRCHGRDVEIGKFLSEEERLALAKELKRNL